MFKEKRMPILAHNLSYGGDICIYLRAPIGKERTAQEGKLYRNPYIRFTSHFDYCNFVDFLIVTLFPAGPQKALQFHIAPGIIPSINFITVLKKHFSKWPLDVWCTPFSLSLFLY